MASVKGVLVSAMKSFLVQQYRYEEGVRPTRAGCQGLGSFWARTLELTGAKNVRVTHTACLREGADRCEFTLAW